MNLRPETYERLQALKLAGLSFDDVVKRLLDRVDREAFYEEVLEEHDSRRKEMEEGNHASLRELREALDE